MDSNESFDQAGLVLPLPPQATPTTHGTATGPTGASPSEARRSASS